MIHTIHFKEFFFTLFILFCLGCSRPEKEIYFIPEGYTGIVYVIYDQKKGSPKEYQSGYFKIRIYNIPESGILKTQFEPNYGGFSKGDKGFVYIDKRSRITKNLNWTSSQVHYVLEDRRKYPIDSVQVFRLGGVSGYSFYDSLDNKKYTGKYSAFIVDSLKNKDKKYPPLQIEDVK